MDRAGSYQDIPARKNKMKDKPQSLLRLRSGQASHSFDFAQDKQVTPSTSLRTSKSPVTEKIIFSGSGGQGIMLMAKVLAQVAMQAGKFVTWLPSYGAEVRGGTARCMLVISDEKIGSPFIILADTLVAMNEPSLKKYSPNLKKGGTLVINTSLAQAGSLDLKDIKLVKIAATEIAVELGNIKVANLVTLGAYLASKKIVSKDAFIKCLFEIAQAINPALFEINKKAFERGYNGKS